MFGLLYTRTGATAGISGSQPSDPWFRQALAGGFHPGFHILPAILRQGLVGRI